jgi:hypothetical protein
MTATLISAQATIDQIRREVTATAVASALTQTALAPTATPPPTVVIIPTAAPPPTLDLALIPTLAVTPVFITATPGGIVLPFPTLTPFPAQASPVPGGVPASPIPPPTSLPIPTAITLVVNVPEVPQLAPGLNTTFSFALTTDGPLGARFALSGGAWRFSLNPQTGLYARVDDTGRLYLNAGPNFGGSPLTTSPFTPFGGTLEENNAPVGQIAWSPDGRYLAFLVDTELDSGSSNDSNPDDGLWYYDPAAGSAFALIFDCRPEAVCLANIDGEPQRLRSQSFQWNLASNALLVRLTLPEEGGRAAFTVTTVPGNAGQRTRVHRYDSAAWSIDNQTVIASGTSPSGQVGVFRVNPADGAATTLFDAGARGLWVQDAVEALDGRIFMLCTGAGRGAPLALCDGRGVPLTGPIGTSAPIRVEWSPNRQAVLVVTQDGDRERYFVARISGGTPVELPADQVADVLAVEWIPSGIPLPQSAGGGSPGVQPQPIPPPVSPVSVGGTALVINPAGLNVRATASTGGALLGRILNGVTVQVLGGPVDAEGYRWWQVTALDGETAGLSGWVVEAVGEQRTLEGR